MAGRGGEGGGYSRASFEASQRAESDSAARLNAREADRQHDPDAEFDLDTVHTVYQKTPLPNNLGQNEQKGYRSDIRTYAESKLKQRAQLDSAMREAFIENDKKDREDTPENMQRLIDRRDQAASSLRAQGIDARNPMGPLTEAQNNVLGVYESASRKLTPLVESKVSAALDENKAFDDRKKSDASEEAKKNDEASKELTKQMRDAAKDDRDFDKEKAAKPYSREEDARLREQRDVIEQRLLDVGLNPYSPLPDQAARDALPMADSVKADIVSYNRLNREISQLQEKARSEAEKERPERDRIYLNDREETELTTLESDLENARSEVIVGEDSRRHWWQRQRPEAEAALDRNKRRYNRLYREYTRRRAIQNNVADLTPDQRLNLGRELQKKITTEALDLRNTERILRVNEAIDREIGDDRFTGRVVRFFKQHPSMRIALSATLVGGAMVVVPAGAGALAIAGGATVLGLGVAGIREGLSDMMRTMRDPDLRLYRKESARDVESMRNPRDIERMLAKQEEWLIRRGLKIEQSGYKESIEAGRRLSKVRAMRQYERALERGTEPAQARTNVIGRTINYEIRQSTAAREDEITASNERIREAARAGLISGLSFGLIRGIEFAQLGHQGAELANASLDPNIVHNFSNTEVLSDQGPRAAAQHTVQVFAERFGLNLSPEQVNLATQTLVHEAASTGPNHTLVGTDSIRFGGDLILQAIRLTVGRG